MEQLSKSALTAINSFAVSLTYIFTTPALEIVFTCKAALEADDIAARQAFFVQPQGDIDAGMFKYNVDMLSRIVEKVEGLPGFDVLFEGPGPVAEGDDAPKWNRPTVGDAIKQYFSTGEPMLQKIAKDAMERYVQISQPTEFFR